MTKATASSGHHRRDAASADHDDGASAKHRGHDDDSDGAGGSRLGHDTIQRRGRGIPKRRTEQEWAVPKVQWE